MTPLIILTLIALLVSGPAWGDKHSVCVSLTVLEE